MVIYSNEIKDFLDKIYFYKLSHREDLNFPLYNYYEGKLYDIDKLTRHTPSSTFPMSRDGLFGLIVGRLEFGYSFDGTNACVEYYVNREPQNDWFDWLIKESKQVRMNTITTRELSNVINECIDSYIKHLKRGYKCYSNSRIYKSVVNENKSYPSMLNNRKTKTIIRLTEYDLVNIVKQCLYERKSKME